MSGRLIRPKTWDRIVKIFGARFGQSTNCLGSLWCNLCNKLCFGVYEAGNGHGIRFHKVEPMFAEWVAHGQPTVLFWACKTSPGLYELDQKGPCVVYIKLFEVNGLSCVEINRLMHEHNVLT